MCGIIISVQLKWVLLILFLICLRVNAYADSYGLKSVIYTATDTIHCYMEFPLDGFDEKIKYKESNGDKKSLKIKTEDVLMLEIGSRKYERVQYNRFNDELMEVMIDGSITLYYFIKVLEAEGGVYNFTPTNGSASIGIGGGNRTEKYFVQKKGDLVTYKKKKIAATLALFMADNEELVLFVSITSGARSNV